MAVDEMDRYHVGILGCSQRQLGSRVTSSQARVPDPASRSVSREGSWPSLAGRSADAAGSVMSFPLVADGVVIGAVTFAARWTRAFGGVEIAAGCRFADEAATVLSRAQAYWWARCFGVLSSTQRRDAPR